MVDCVGVVVIEVLNPLLKARVLQTFVDGAGEEPYVGVQGELVHGVDATHIVHHKEQERGTLGTGTIALGGGRTRVVNEEGGNRVQKGKRGGRGGKLRGGSTNPNAYDQF